jgi:hypothetical protein
MVFRRSSHLTDFFLYRTELKWQCAPPGQHALYKEKDMQYEVSKEGVSRMADRIVVKHTELTKPKALEVLATGFGYRNFDAMSGTLAAEKPGGSTTGPDRRRYQWPGMKLQNPISIFITTYALVGGIESPEWVNVVLTPLLLARIQELQETVIRFDLNTVSASLQPDDWDDGPENDALNMGAWQLCVSEDGFWFQGWPKHASVHCESRIVYFASLAQAILDPTLDTGAIAWIGESLFVDNKDAKAFKRLVDCTPR